jgi:hypothetical protein
MRAPLRLATASPKPKSIVFNGINGYINLPIVTSGGSTTIFTYSIWFKSLIVITDSLQMLQVINAPTNTQFLFLETTLAGDRFGVGQDFGTVDWQEFVSPLTPDVLKDVWEHWVVQFDSTQGVADNRMKFYRNGVFLADTDATSLAPGPSEAHILFQNGFSHQIGGYTDTGYYGKYKAAFIEVLDGVSADANSFGFTSGGVWIRKPYTGSYGKYGFRLDGTRGFSDASGNGQNFTGVNMSESDLDSSDLPPYVS